MITKEIELLKLFPVIPNKSFIEVGLNIPSLYKGFIGIKTELGLVPATIEGRHISFYKREFKLDDKEIQKLIVK